MRYIRHMNKKLKKYTVTYTRFVARCNMWRYIVQVDVAGADSPPALRQSFSHCLRKAHVPTFRLCSRSISPTWGTLELLSRFRTVWSFKETQNVSRLNIIWLMTLMTSCSLNVQKKVQRRRWDYVSWSEWRWLQEATEMKTDAVNGWACQAFVLFVAAEQGWISVRISSPSKRRPNLAYATETKLDRTPSTFFEVRPLVFLGCFEVSNLTLGEPRFLKG